MVKAVDGNFEVVGLHRGKFDKGFNCGTTFKDITKCISGKVYNAGIYVSYINAVVMWHL